MKRQYLLGAAVVLSSVCFLACRGRTSDLAFHRGVNAAQGGRPDLARLYFDEQLRAEPADVEALRHLGRAWMTGALQSPSRAAEAWRALLALVPGDPEAHLALANVSFLLGDLETALDHLNDAGGGDEADLLKAKILLESDPAAAVGFAQDRLSKDGSPKLYLTLAQATELLGSEPETLRWARLAVEAEPLSSSARYLLSRSLQRQGQVGDAEREARAHALLQALAVPATTTSGDAASTLGTLDELVSLLDPVPDGLRRLRLDALCDAGLKAQALDLLALAAETEGHFGATRGQLAGWYERIGRTAEAQRLLEAELDRAADPAIAASLSHRLARLYRAVETEKAETLARRAIAEAPDTATHHCLLGELLIERGSPTEAAAALERALELAPWRADCRVALARVRHAAGEREAVLELLAEAPEVDGRLRSFRDRYGYTDGANH